MQTSWLFCISRHTANTTQRLSDIFKFPDSQSWYPRDVSMTGLESIEKSLLNETQPLLLITHLVGMKPMSDGEPGKARATQLGLSTYLTYRP